MIRELIDQDKGKNDEKIENLSSEYKILLKILEVENNGERILQLRTIHVCNIEDLLEHYLWKNLRA